MNLVCVEREWRGSGLGLEELGLWSPSLGWVPDSATYRPCDVGQITTFTSQFPCLYYNGIVIVTSCKAFRIVPGL